MQSNEYLVRITLPDHVEGWDEPSDFLEALLESNIQPLGEFTIIDRNPAQRLAAAAERIADVFDQIGREFDHDTTHEPNMFTDTWRD